MGLDRGGDGRGDGRGDGGDGDGDGGVTFLEGFLFFELALGLGGVDGALFGHCLVAGRG